MGFRFCLKRMFGHPGQLVFGSPLKAVSVNIHGIPCVDIAKH